MSHATFIVARHLSPIHGAPLRRNASDVAFETPTRLWSRFWISGLRVVGAPRFPPSRCGGPWIIPRPILLSVRPSLQIYVRGVGDNYLSHISITPPSKPTENITVSPLSVMGDL